MKQANRILILAGSGLGAATVIFFLLNLTHSRDGIANAASKGETLFATTCASCHAGGKNIVTPAKPVIGSKKLASEQVFKTYLIKPDGTMPPFPNIANNPSDLKALLEYTKTLK